ncbi:MAG: helix-turn-helix domain-containing protein [Planctomycetota bacterium]|nr:helix-turn-helix domain-containing protein [Planctomycetota bacterium]
MLTVKQVAQQLNVSLGSVYKSIRRGDLEHHRFGASIRVSEEQLAEFVEGTRVRTDPDLLDVTEFKHL